MIQKIFNLILALAFLSLVILFSYKEMNKPEILTTTLNKNNANTEQHSEKNLSKEEVNNIIKDYIINNPEIIVESLEGLHNKKNNESIQKAAEYLKENKQKIESEDNPPMIGNPDGDITMVVFYDYNCSFCKKASDIENEILQIDRGVKIILRPIPILDDSSMYAAKVILAVQRINNESLQAIHNELMKLKIINEEQVKPILAKYNIDYAIVENEINSYGIKQLISKNFEFAKEIGIKGTPSCVINGKFIPGLISLDKLKNIIIQIRAGS
ncbi:MAG: DsbA family protein [Rickettsiales bacterium]|nr:MAG: DsbA family protein [Rickettsiales bacterium]